MKRSRLFLLLLCAAMVFQLIGSPVLAVDDVTVPPTEGEIPTVITGDASVSSGCRTIDAQKPLADVMDYEVGAKATIAYEMTTGTLIYAMNPDLVCYPASLTKIMTCLLALEMGNPDDMVTVSSTAIADIPNDSSSAHLQAGEQMSLQNLLYCLMVESAGDAGSVVAEYIAGSEGAFVDLMNQRALQLGCENTHFANSHGLHDDNHYTTARDLAKITLAALEFEAFRQIYSVAVYEVPATNMSDKRTLYSTNYMLGEQIMKGHMDKRVTGGKTGFTTPAGRCLMATAVHDDMNVLTIMLGAQQNVDEDGITILRYGSFEETSALLDYIFDNYKTAEVLSPNMVGQFSVPGARNDVAVSPLTTTCSVLPADYDQDNKMQNMTVDYVPNDNLSAPIQAGQTVGTVRAWYQSTCVAQASVAAVNAVALSPSAGQNGEGNSVEGQTEGMSEFMRIFLGTFLGLVALVLVLAIISGIRNAILRAKRRRRRKSRRRSR